MTFLSDIETSPEVLPEIFQPATIDKKPRIHISSYHHWKGYVSRIIAGILLIPGSVAILLLAGLIRATSRGPAIFKQTRVGKHGKTFVMYKLRTMSFGAEDGNGPVWAQKNDPRITKVGRILRKLHLDEFPQLVNVVRGEMDLIGPRPERPEFTQVLAKRIPGYLDRLEVLPGITGLAQINLPPDTTLECVRRKVVLDREYIQTATLLLDLRMAVCTCMRLVGISGDIATIICGLGRNVDVGSTLSVDGHRHGSAAGSNRNGSTKSGKAGAAIAGATRSIEASRVTSSSVSL